MASSSSASRWTEAARRGLGLLALALCALGWGGRVQAQEVDTWACGDPAIMSARKERPGVIKRLDLQCDLAMCQVPVEGRRPEDVKEGFRRVTDLCEGADVSPELLDAAVARLQKTGFFETVTWRVKALDGGWDVTLEMRGAQIIRDVTYKGNAPLLESDLQKRLQLVRGRSFASTQGALRAQASSINDLYEQNGFYGTQTLITPRPVEGERNLVDVEVEVKKGIELEVTRVVIGGAQAKSYQAIRSLLLEPIGWFGRFTRKNLSDGVQNVLDAYRADGYYRVRIVNKEVRECVTIGPGCDAPGQVEVFLEIDEGPRWELVFQGNPSFDAAELQEQVTFTESGYVDDVEIGRTKDAIVGFYETAGHYFATVTHEEIEQAEGQRRLTFMIDEGPRAEIREVRIDGADHLDADTIKAQLATRPYGLFQAGVGFLQLPAIKSDLKRISAIYQAEGYLLARAERWRLEARDGAQNLRVVIQVEEGPQTLLGDVTFVRVIPNPALVPPLSPVRDGMKSAQRGGRRRERPAETPAPTPDPDTPQEPVEPLPQEPPEADTTDLSDAALPDQPPPPADPTSPAEPAALPDFVLTPRAQLGDEALRRGGLLKVGDAFRPEQVALEQKRLVEAYRSQGYPQAQVRVECRGERGVWGECALPQIRDECFTPPEEDAAATPAARRAKRKKDPFCTESEQDGIIVHSCRPTRDDMACLPQGGLQGDRVEVRFLIYEGKQLRVGEIFLRGHFRTRPGVIYDELELKEGDTFDVARFFKSQSNLRSLGLFDSVSIDTIGVEEDAIALRSQRREATVLVAVEEALAIYLEGNVGVETRNLLTVSPSLISTIEAGLIANNILGYGKQLQVRGRFAFDFFSLLDALQLPADAAGLFTGDFWQEQAARTFRLDYLVGAEVILRDPRFFVLRDAGWLSVVADASLTTYYTRDLLGAENLLLDKDEVGVRPELRGLFANNLTALVRLEWKNTATRRRDEDPRTLEGARLFDPRRNTTSISPQLTFDQRDSPLNPTRGYFLEGKFDLAFAVFDSPTEFYRVTTGGAWFKTFGSALTVGVGGRVGWAVPFGDTVFIPENERFRLGGSSTLRGFNENVVGPLDLNFLPLGGELLTEGHAELRFPLLPSANLFGAYFVDTGLLVDCVQNRAAIDFNQADVRIACLDDVHLDDWRTSAGLGVRLLVAGQIPIVLDWGILLNRKIGEPVGRLHLDVSYAF